MQQILTDKTLTKNKKQPQKIYIYFSLRLRVFAVKDGTRITLMQQILTDRILIKKQL